MRILPEAAIALGHVVASGLDAPILDSNDTRWNRLLFSYPSGFDLRDRFRGALIGGAIGDAMGRPNESRPTEVARERKLRAYQPWHGWTGGPKGTITDDSQMTMWLSESILAAGTRDQRSKDRDQQEPNRRTEQLADRLIDPDDIIQRFTREHIRGIGQAVRGFVHNYRDLGKPWHEAGVPSAGNGTAMRAAPVGLVHFGDAHRTYRDSLLQSVVTHRDSMAIASAVCQRSQTGRCAKSAKSGKIVMGDPAVFSLSRENPPVNTGRCLRMFLDILE